MMEIANKGIKTKDYYKALFNQVKDGFNELTRFDLDQKAEYGKLLANLKEVNNNRTSYDTFEIGKALENIVNFILQGCSIFDIIPNLHSTTNEIDQLVILNDMGMFFKENGYLKFEDNYFIGECKNYNKKIDVTWIGKFFSLVNTSSCRLGVLFSYHGLNGRSEWNDAKGFVKKLYLSKERLTDRICIINFNIEDFENIANGESFLNILDSKIAALRTDTSFEKHITEHPGETKLKNAVEDHNLVNVNSSK